LPGLLSQRRWLAALLALRHPGAEQYFCRPRLRASGRNNFLQHRQKQRRGLITADSQPQLQVPENPFAPRRKNKIPKKKTEEEKKRISMNLSEEDCPKKMGTLTPRFQRHSSTAPGTKEDDPDDEQETPRSTRSHTPFYEFSRSWSEEVAKAAGSSRGWRPRGAVQAREEV
jgi:hypothetical protein